MKATRDNKKSWEKQTLWKLENGWVATEEWNHFHGSFIKRLDSPEGKMWLASNGSKENIYSIGGAEKANEIFGGDKYVDLPDWAEAWRDDFGLVRLNFEKIFGK